MLFANLIRFWQTFIECIYCAIRLKPQKLINFFGDKTMEDNKTGESSNLHDNNSTHSEPVCVKCQDPQKDVLDFSHDRNYKEKFMRTLADFENFKHRVEKEKARWATDAQVDIIQSFLLLIDDIERAAEVAPRENVDSAIKPWVDGVVKIFSNNQIMLQKMGIQEIITSGAFDPELHEALCQMPATVEIPAGNVLQVLRKGYIFNGTVIRHAQVSVTQ